MQTMRMKSLIHNNNNNTQCKLSVYVANNWSGFQNRPLIVFFSFISFNLLWYFFLHLLNVTRCGDDAQRFVEKLVTFVCNCLQIQSILTDHYAVHGPLAMLNTNEFALFFDMQSILTYARHLEWQWSHFTSIRLMWKRTVENIKLNWNRVQICNNCRSVCTAHSYWMNWISTVAQNDWIEANSKLRVNLKEKNVYWINHINNIQLCEWKEPTIQNNKFNQI